MKKQILFSLFMLCFVLTKAFSIDPPSRFPSNSEDFMRALKTFIESAKQKEATQAYAAFEQQVKKGIYSDEELLKIVNLSNSMLDLKLKACPYFCDYLKGLNQLKSNVKNAHLFDNWHLVLQGMLIEGNTKKLKPYQSMLTFSLNYFEKGVLNQTRSGMVWKALSIEAQFEMKDKEPCLVFEETNLICEKNKESLLIKATKGCFFPVDKKWKGNGGQVNWDKENMSDVYCEFKEYEIKLDKGLYKVKEAILHYPKYFEGKTIEGALQDKVLMGGSKKGDTYPIFESNTANHEIKKLGEDIIYRGGVRLKGTKLYGSGTSEKKAFIRIYSADKKYHIDAYAKQFVIEENVRISGEEVATSIYMGTDSICHPSVNFKLMLPSKELSLQRGKRGSNRNPFYNSFTQMNMDTERLDWDMATTEIVINEKKVKIGNTNKKVTFESTAFFDSQDYRKLQNVSSVHPLAILKNVADSEKSTIISAENYAQALNTRFDVTSIQSLIYDLVAKGYITYNKENKQINILDKVFHYCDASMDKKDYDVLKIRSESDKTNARLLLDQKQIIASDVNILEFSDLQKVAARPLKGEVVMGANRGLSFDGRLFAGLGILEGKDFHFDYDKFQLSVDSIRYFDMFLPTGEKDASGVPEAYSIGSRIEHAAGILLIDAPQNKSGREDIKTFPAFKSTRNAYVYYDMEETLDGCYNRDSFYYELFPFTLNNLDEFERENFEFKGQMVTADIFPTFKETLLIQEEDHSLGFTHKLPAEGYLAYGKGPFFGSLNVSNNGLRGDGTIKYLWATIDSKDAIFKPNQMLSSAENFELVQDANADIPLISGVDIEIDWRPYQDSMFVTAKKESFKLYKDGEHTLHNMLILTPDGLKGRGVFEWGQGTMKADLFNLGANTVGSDSTNLDIKVAGVNDLALHTNNVSSSFDFAKNVGHVKANADSITTMLPYNKYETSMNEFTWDINGELVTFLSGKKEYGSFLALGKDRDSLSFDGKTAQFNLKNNELKVGGVPFIQVADAFLYPDNGDVKILPGGEITTLKNAKIEANTKNKYHVFNKATIDINSRYQYQASGFYQYDIEGRKQEVKFTDIQGTFVKKGKKNKMTETTATTSVTADDNFYMDSKLRFKGEVSLKAAKESLLFHGFAKLDVPVLKDADWFSIECDGDRNNLMLKYDVPKNTRGADVYTGLFVDRMTRKIYPNIMKGTRSSKDMPLFIVKGYLSERASDKQLLFGDSLKIASGVKHGDLLSLSDQGEVFAEGQFSFGPKAKLANATIVGSMMTTIEENGTEDFNFMAGLNMYLPEKLIQIIQADFDANIYNMKRINYKPYVFYEKALAELVPDSKARHAMIAELKSANDLVFPAKQNNFNFLFSKLPMEWNSDYHAFVSKGKLGLASINGKMYNSTVESYIEFKITPDGEQGMAMYLATPSGTYYYLSYLDGILSTVSNNQQFMDLLLGMKEKELKKKVKGEGLYEINPVGPATADMFVRKIKGE